VRRRFRIVLFFSARRAGTTQSILNGDPIQVSARSILMSDKKGPRRSLTGTRADAGSITETMTLKEVRASGPKMSEKINCKTKFRHGQEPHRCLSGHHAAMR
jgi:hypothetical protein